MSGSTDRETLAVYAQRIMHWKLGSPSMEGRPRGGRESPNSDAWGGPHLKPPPFPRSLLLGQLIGQANENLVLLHLPGPGPHRHTRYEPRGMKGYRRYSALAPRADMLKMPYEQYRPLYVAILERLDPAKVVEELTRMADGNEPVLLCWERPPLTETNWCHRRMVAEWLEQQLGISVPEI